jgi:hypothetical protein
MTDPLLLPLADSHSILPKVIEYFGRDAREHATPVKVESHAYEMNCDLEVAVATAYMS